MPLVEETDRVVTWIPVFFMFLIRPSGGKSFEAQIFFLTVVTLHLFTSVKRESITPQQSSATMFQGHFDTIFDDKLLAQCKHSITNRETWHQKASDEEP